MQTMWFVMFENGFKFTIRKYLLLTISLAKDILNNPIWKSRNTKQTDALISKLPITVWSYVCSTWLPLDSISILPIEFPVTPQAGFVPLQRKQPISGEGCVLHSGSATLSRFLCGGRSRFRCDPPPCLEGCDPFLFLLRILQRRRIWSKVKGIW